LAAPVIERAQRFNSDDPILVDATDGAREAAPKADVILALDVADLFGSLTTVSKQTRDCEYITSPGVKLISISMNDMLVHSWANDFQALQPLDLPMCADLGCRSGTDSTGAVKLSQRRQDKGRPRGAT